MRRKDINIAITSPQAHDAVTALIDMNNIVGYATHVNDISHNNELLVTIKNAHYYATKTIIDVDNIDTRLHDVMGTLLMEAKLAYDYFCKKIDNPMAVKLMIIANHQTTAQLMKLNES